MKTLRAVLISFLLSAAFTGCRHEAQDVHASATVTGLQIAEVRAAQISDAAPIVGTVEAKESASLSAQVIGRVTAVLVHEGEAVRAGQVLVRIDDAQARAGVDHAQSSVAAAEHYLDAAKSQAALAASTLARYQVLREQKSVSPQEFDEVSRRSEEASAQLAAAQANLEAQKASAGSAGTLAGYSTITAPFAGLVTARHVDPGALASPGVALVDIDRAGPLQLVVSVDESLLRNIEPGSPFVVSIPAISPDPVSARVAQIVPAADTTSHSFTVKIDLPASAYLRAGMYGTTSISSSTRNALFIPRSALVEHGTIHSIWVLDAQHVASLRYVTLGPEMGSNVEILSGVNAGEQIVLSPGDRELGGSRIEARP